MTGAVPSASSNAAATQAQFERLFADDLEQLEVEFRAWFQAL